MGVRLRKATVSAVVGLVAVGWSVQSNNERLRLAPTLATAQAQSRPPDCPPDPLTPANRGCVRYKLTQECPSDFSTYYFVGLAMCQYTPVIAAPPAGDQSGGHKHGSSIAPVIVGVGILGGLLALSQAQKGAKEKAPSRPPTVQELLENGPQLFPVYALNTFPTYGLIGNGWPVVVDYAAAPDAETVLTVTVGDRTWSRRLEPGAHLVQLAYDAGDAPATSVALFSVESVAHTPSGDEPRTVEVYGIGAGERAVGSVAIDSLRFGPSILRGGAEQASFAYMRKKSFDKVAADVIRYALEQDKKSRKWLVNTTKVWSDDPLRNAGAGPSGDRLWPGLDLKRKVSHGRHRLQVRGWQVQPDQGWVAAISQQVVDVN